VTLRDGVVVIVEYPRVAADSLTGWAVGAEPPLRLAFPVDSVQSIERWRNETFAAVLVGAGVGGLLFLSYFPFWGGE
jgi:hypothetical protein